MLRPSTRYLPALPPPLASREVLGSSLPSSPASWDQRPAQDNELLRLRAEAIASKANEARWSKAASRAHDDVEELIRVAKQREAALAAAEQQCGTLREENTSLQERVATLEQWRLAVDGVFKSSGITVRVEEPAAEAAKPKDDQYIEPITYPEAFDAIGGAAKLEEYEGVSREIEMQVSDAAMAAELKKLLPRDYEKRTGFSTKLVNQPYVRNLEELYAQANQIHASFDAVIRLLAKLTDGVALIPPLKGEIRARMKALFKCVETEASEAP
jgi:hypothetical protein